MSNPLTDLIDFFPSLIGVGTDPLTNFAGDISNWFGSLGGEIGSGLEAAGIAIFKDLWNVVIGPLEIGVGTFLIIVALFLIFKDDLMSAGAMFGMMAL